jgi:hypothetical protein
LHIHRVRSSFLYAFALIFSLHLCLGQERPRLTPEQQREFLLNAEVIRARETEKGITNSHRLTLSDGEITHDAHFQSINERRRRKGGEMNFVDSYLYNIAAYELARIIGLDDMLPVTVERKWQGKTGSMSWWLPVQMDEKTREEKKIRPPDPVGWNNSMSKILLFTELIFDTDRSRENVLIGDDWNLYMIDFSRAFRLNNYLKNPQNLVRCSRELLDKLRALETAELEEKAGKCLTGPELEAVLKRRDKIVDHFEKLIREKGEVAVLY